MEESRAVFLWRLHVPQQGGSLILLCHRSSSLCCKGDSITETNTGKELRSRFQFSVLQTPRNENNLCNLNRINLNAPKGSRGLFLGCKHCHPDFGNDRLKVQSSVEVRLWPCRVRALSRAERRKQTSVGAFLPNHHLQATCSCTLLAKTPVLRGGLRADSFAPHLHHPWEPGGVRKGSSGRWSWRCGMREPGSTAVAVAHSDHQPMWEALASPGGLPLVPDSLEGTRGIPAIEGVRDQLLPRSCQWTGAQQVCTSSTRGRTWTSPRWLNKLDREEEHLAPYKTCLEHHGPGLVLKCLLGQCYYWPFIVTYEY